MTRRSTGVAFEALKGGRTVSELATAYEVHPTVIHQWKKAFPESAAGILEPRGKATTTAEVAEDTRAKKPGASLSLALNRAP